MKTIITLLAGFSLALAGAVIAQQPEGQETPAKKGGGKEKTEHATETKPARNTAPGEKKGNATNTEKPTPTETGVKQHGTKGERNAKGQTTANAETSPAAEGNASPQAGKKGRQGRNAKENAAAETAATASPGASQPMEQGKKGRQGRAANAKTSPSPSATVAAASATPATSATVAAGATGATAMTKEQGTVGRGGKKVEQQQVQQIKQQHASFRAQPRPDKAPAVTFNANFRIEGAERWQGPQYEVFRSYHPEWHDQGWYRSRYGRVELIGGGYYYWNSGYWYPAWGYDSSAAYYPYDGPIYVGRSAEPLDRVIADVQSELQQMGYYQGEVDGLLGPLTRQALRDYQADHGLEVTEVIDEPTLDALQLG